MMGILENWKSFITHSDYMMFLLQLWKFKDLTPVCCILMRYRNLQYLNVKFTDKRFASVTKQLNVAVRWQQAEVFHSSMDVLLIPFPVFFLFNAEYLLCGCKYVHSYKIWCLAVSHKHKRGLVFIQKTQSGSKRVCI